MQVRGSSTESKRSFLQKKGLTEGEITEAIKRVPEASDTTVGLPSSSTTASQLAQVSRPQKPFPTASASGQPFAQAQAVQAPQALQPAGYRWSQVRLVRGTVLNAACTTCPMCIEPRQAVTNAGFADSLRRWFGGSYSLGCPESCSAIRCKLVQMLGWQA